MDRLEDVAEAAQSIERRMAAIEEKVLRLERDASDHVPISRFGDLQREIERVSSKLDRLLEAR